MEDHDHEAEETPDIFKRLVKKKAYAYFFGKKWNTIINFWWKTIAVYNYGLQSGIRIFNIAWQG